MARRNIVLLVLAIVAGALLSEVGARLYYGPLPDSLLDWSNFIVKARRPGASIQIVRPDPEMGWVGVANFVGDGLSHGPDGLRTMPRIQGEEPILVVGDSFAYGAEARD